MAESTMQSNEPSPHGNMFSMEPDTFPNKDGVANADGNQSQQGDVNSSMNGNMQSQEKLQNQNQNNDQNNVFGGKVGDDYGVKLEDFNDSHPSNQHRRDDPKSNPDNFEHWQSQADKYRTENEKILQALGVQNYGEFENRYEGLGSTLPIARFIEQGDAKLNINGNQVSLYDAVQSAINGGELQLQQAQNQQLQNEQQINELKMPEKPKRPVKPADFSQIDAEADKDSPSAKYLEESSAYVEKLLDYQDKIANYYDERNKEAYEVVQRRTALEQRNAMLTQNFGFDQNAISDFDRFINHLQTEASVGEIVNLYKLSKMPTASQMKIEQRANEIQNKNTNISSQQANQNTQQQAEQEDQLSEEDAFNMALIKGAKGREIRF